MKDANKISVHVEAEVNPTEDPEKVKKAVDIYSMMRARSSIDHSDIVLLLIDGMEGVTTDDIKIFSYIRRSLGCKI